MSMSMEDTIKRWTAKREAALVMDITKGKTTVAEASRSFDLTPAKVEEWVDEAKRDEKQIKDLQEAYGEAMLELRARKNYSPCWARATSNQVCSAETGRGGYSGVGLQVVPLV